MLKVIRISAMVILALAVFSQPAMSRDFAEIYTDCGLGAMIAPKSDAVAAVTNVTWDLGTTAISSNISSPDTCVGGKEKTAAFIHDSYESLEKDLASGDGTYLDALTVLVEIDSQAKQEFVSDLRNDFSRIVANPGYTDQSHFDKAEALYNLVYRHVEAMSKGRS